MSFDVVITGYQANAPRTLAVVLEDLLGLEPAEARERTQRLPATVIAGTSEAHARSAANQLREVGAVVQIVRQARKTAPRVSVREATSVPTGHAPTMMSSAKDANPLIEAVAKAVAARAAASSTASRVQLDPPNQAAAFSAPQVERAQASARNAISSQPPPFREPSTLPPAAPPDAAARSQPAPFREPSTLPPAAPADAGAELGFEEDPFAHVSRGIGPPASSATGAPMLPSNPTAFDDDPFASLESTRETKPDFNAPWLSNHDKPLQRVLAAKADRDARERAKALRGKSIRVETLQRILIPVALLTLVMALGGALLYRRTRAQQAQKERALAAQAPEAPATGADETARQEPDVQPPASTGPGTGSATDGGPPKSDGGADTSDAGSGSAQVRAADAS